MPKAKRKLRLLVVDDEKEVCEFIKRIFKKKGFITHSASSGRAAIKAAKKIKPDIALIDLYLSRGMNGLGALSELRKVAPHCLSAMITWDISQEKVQGAKDLGAVCYLAKPLTVRGLGKAIGKMVKKISRGGEQRG